MMKSKKNYQFSPIQQSTGAPRLDFESYLSNYHHILQIHLIQNDGFGKKMDLLENTRIKPLKAPLGINDIEFDINKTKYNVFERLFQRNSDWNSPTNAHRFYQIIVKPWESNMVWNIESLAQYMRQWETLFLIDRNKYFTYNGNFKMWDEGQMNAVLSFTAIL